MTTDRDFDSTAYGRGYKDGKRDAAAEIARLRAGGCARDQGLTQYCAEAARLAEENERLRAALQDIIADSFSVYAIQVARTALGGKDE